MQAILLAAGMGRRFGGRDNKAKINILGDTLFLHCLQALKEANIHKLIVVTGYNYEAFEEYITLHKGNIEIVFIRNHDYETTNNIWSLYLAKEHLTADDTLLIESDLIFDRTLLKRVVENKASNIAVVSKLEDWMDGTTVLLENEKISRMVSKQEFCMENYDRSFKTVNIYKFSQAFLRDQYIPALQQYIRLNGKKDYYEMALKRLIDKKETTIMAHVISEKWYEIDTEEDLKLARALFN